MWRTGGYPGNRHAPQVHGRGFIEGTRAGYTAVRADRYWGASTQWTLRADLSVTDHLPERFHRCYGVAKKAAVAANGEAGRLPSWKVDAIAMAVDDLVAGRLSDHFPLTVWQSGSGRETDPNVDEVLANRAIQLLGGAIGSRGNRAPRALRPVIALSVLNAVRTLGQACVSVSGVVLSCIGKPADARFGRVLRRR